jgi:hypothetical protein
LFEVLDAQTLTVVGTLDIAGRSRSVTVPLTVAEDGTIRGRVTIVQSEAVLDRDGRAEGRRSRRSADRGQAADRPTVR